MKSSLFRGLATMGAAVVLGSITLPAANVVAQEIRIDDSAVTLSSGADGRAELWIELADGSEHRLMFSDETIEFDGRAIGRYEPGGTLLVEWREFLREYAGTDASALQAGLIEWGERVSEWGERTTDAEGQAATSLGRRLVDLLRETDEADSRTPEAAATSAAPNTSRLAIAPGGVELDELMEQLDRLHDELGQLGAAAKDATDELALIVHDDFAISGGEVIAGNVALLDGTLEIAGSVAGNVLVLDGTLILVDGARIEGDVLQVGGELELAGEIATILGEVVSDFPAVGVAPKAPTVAAASQEAAEDTSRGSGRGSYRSNPIRRFTRNLGHAAEEFFGAVSTFIALGAIGLLLVYFFHGRVETVADTVRHDFARSFAMGIAAEVLFFPALLILCVLVITWPIVPFFVLGTGLAMLAGYLAVAHGAGEMFARRRYRYAWLERIRRSNSYYYILSGLVLLLLPFAATAILWVLGGTAGFVRGIVAFVAAIGTWILMTAGFGSVLLTRAGSRSIVVDWSESGADPLDPIVPTEPTAETTTPASESDDSDG